LICECRFSQPESFCEQGAESIPDSSIFDLRNRFSQIFLFGAEAQRDPNVAQTSRLRPIDSQAGGWRCFFERHLEKD